MMGNTGSEKGVWTFTVGKDPGEMYGTGYSSDVSYFLEAQIGKGGQVGVYRTKSSDGDNCTYNGQKNEDIIKGTFICASNPQPTPWQAVVSYCLK